MKHIGRLKSCSFLCEPKDWRYLLILLVAWTATACVDGANCAELKGVYPPESVTVVAVEAVEAPYTAWGCQGYDSGPLVEDIPDLPVGPTQEIRIEVAVKDGGELEVRALTPKGERRLDVDADGQSHTVAPLPEESTGLFIRLCTNDGRCANYEVSLSHRSD
jgi:hypothetical protein